MTLALVPYSHIWHIISIRERFLGKEGRREGGIERKKELVYLHLSRGWRDSSAFHAQLLPLNSGKVRKKYNSSVDFRGGPLTHHRSNQMDGVEAYAWCLHSSSLAYAKSISPLRVFRNGLFLTTSLLGIQSVVIFNT